MSVFQKNFPKFFEFLKKIFNYLNFLKEFLGISENFLEFSEFPKKFLEFIRKNSPNSLNFILIYKWNVRLSNKFTELGIYIFGARTAPPTAPQPALPPTTVSSFFFLFQYRSVIFTPILSEIRKLFANFQNYLKIFPTFRNFQKKNLEISKKFTRIFSIFQKFTRIFLIFQSFFGIFWIFFEIFESPKKTIYIFARPLCSPNDSHNYAPPTPDRLPHPFFLLFTLFNLGLLFSHHFWVKNKNFLSIFSIF